MITRTAAALAGLHGRQVCRLLDAFRVHGPDALLSKRRGNMSDRATARPSARSDWFLMEIVLPPILNTCISGA